MNCTQYDRHRRTARPEAVSIGRDIIEAARHVEGVVAVRDRLSYPSAALASCGPLF